MSRRSDQVGEAGIVVQNLEAPIPPDEVEVGRSPFDRSLQVLEGAFAIAIARMDQGEIVAGATRYLHCSGQVAVKPDADSELGISVVSPGEIRGQMECALANIDAVLANAGMARQNIISLRSFTTDVDGFLANHDVYASWIGQAGTPAVAARDSAARASRTHDQNRGHGRRIE